MQRWIALIVVVCLCLQAVALLAVLGYVRVVATSEAKRQLRATSDASEYRWFVVDNRNYTTAGDELTWLDGREFRVGDAMYDVIERRDSGKYMIIKAFPDNAETWSRLHLAPTIDHNVRKQTSSGPIAQRIAQLLLMTGDRPIRTSMPQLEVVALYLEQPQCMPLSPAHAMLEIPPEHL